MPAKFVNLFQFFESKISAQVEVDVFVEGSLDID
jgi:hypothetical protein